MKSISLCDFSDFEVGNCGNGGKYGFKTIFKSLPDGRNFEVSYKTTSHLNYCDKCGEWHDPRTCQQDYEVISGQEVAARVINFKKIFVDNEVNCFIETE